MSGTFVDTNVLLDLVTQDPGWISWSVMQLEAAALEGPLIINDVVYAELSIRYRDSTQLDRDIASLGAVLTPMPRKALFLAGKAYMRYREAGGTRTGVPPDFFIGAHASLEGLPRLTRDARRYRSYFPKLILLTPIPAKPHFHLDLCGKPGDIGCLDLPPGKYPHASSAPASPDFIALPDDGLLRP